MLTPTLTQQHRDCDARFALAEEAASQGDLEHARNAHAEFAADITRHLDMEETVLFPEFEQRTGMSHGPVAVMRMEHEQMRMLLARMQQGLDDGDLDDYLDVAETLNVLIQQHNMKEEQILYPMCDQALADRANALLERIGR